MRLNNKVALIAGGSLGIGLAIAVKFAAEGAKVAISGRNDGALADAKQLLQDKGADVLTITADIQFKDQVNRMIDETITKWGCIDILVINAGICNETKFLDITEEDWDLHMNVNLKGAFLAGQRAAEEMIKRKTNGSIIHMSSVNGLKAEGNQAHYNATKGGMNLLSMSMALELAEYGIRVNAVCPGYIQTRLTQPTIDNTEIMDEYLKSIPQGRVGQPEEVADATLFLASDESKYITGHCLVVDGGQVIRLD